MHYVYGTHVAKSEAGFIVTRNRTDFKTAQLVMKTCDPSNTGSVALPQFARGAVYFVAGVWHNSSSLAKLHHVVTQ